MIWVFDYAQFSLLVWAVVAFITVGVWYEIDALGDVDGDDLMNIVGFSCLWPLVISIGAVVAVGWCISWIPRLPTRLIVQTMSKKTDLPRAEVV